MSRMLFGHDKDAIDKVKRFFKYYENELNKESENYMGVEKDLDFDFI